MTEEAIDKPTFTWQSLFLYLLDILEYIWILQCFSSILCWTFHHHFTITERYDHFAVNIT